ncbi:MAG: MerR family transcriptional regulator, thiopeptide resistance regulator, partial [Actinomycetota bacterium]|nr:MerR family transcriptional regulator, thiopeptide resistance regulator [Actinomycetota bacterium]
ARVAVLRAQRELTVQRLALQQQRIELIDRILQEPEGRLTMTTENFDKLPDVDEYAQEARERWGDTDEYQESARRASVYDKDDWARIAAAQREQLGRFAAIFTSGAAPDSEEAMAAAEEARRLIDEWFYPLSPEMHRGLAEMYIADQRFKAHYDEAAPGLAEFVHDAINANADRARSSEDS